MESAFSLHCPCSANDFETIHIYQEPPVGEIRFQFSLKSPYHRELRRCRRCRHIISQHPMDAAGLYRGDYVTSNYGTVQDVKRSFDRINSLSPSQSDNLGRVERVRSFAEDRWGYNFSPSLLDIGSGLCVFLYRMKEAGWTCTALDSDSRLVAHARENVGIAAIQGDFMSTDGIGSYNVISLNKVLEHVAEPGQMLKRTLQFLKPGGFIYLEVPDGEEAWKAGPQREEFFIDHLHVFSNKSLIKLITQAKYRSVQLQREKEPSGKYTLWAFLESLSGGII